MSEYYKDEWVTLYHGDALAILPTLPDASVDAIVTDPPYGIQAASWDHVVPFEVLTDLLRVSVGPVVWFGAATRVMDDILAFPTRPDRMLIWNVSFSLARTAANGIYYRWHPIYCWRLPDRHNGPQRDVLTFSTDGHYSWVHPGTKPLALMRCLTGFCPADGIVLDPFAGSGTTLVAAKATGRHAIGVELDEGYCEIAARRCEATTPMLPGLAEPEQQQMILEGASE